MVQAIETDLCVIGAGSGGLSVAAGAAMMGVPVVMIEKHKLGGDCLNYGCVPSKALLAAGKAAHSACHSHHFGVNAKVDIDYAAAMEHVAGVIKGISPMDSIERFTGMGVRVVEGAGKFVGPDRVSAGDLEIKARRFVIATGSSPIVPPIPGLADVPHFTNETIFENRECPSHLIVIGGGPIGLEMAQAHLRLGAKVTVIEMAQICPKDDAEASRILARSLRKEGLEILEGTKLTAVAKNEPNGITVTVEKDSQSRTIQGSHLLIAAGRRPNLQNLNLEAAGITYNPRGITVDEGMRTTNKRVFAIGDVAGSYQFTHMAGYHAGIVIQQALFRVPAKVNYSAVPWVTFTDPELANVGMLENEAREKLGNIRILRWPFAVNDRAEAEHHTTGMVKVILDGKGVIVGASMVGHNAGELLQPWILAVSQKMKIRAFTSMIAPYPTYGEVNKRAAGAFFTNTLFSPRTRKVVSFLRKFG